MPKSNNYLNTFKILFLIFIIAGSLVFSARTIIKKYFYNPCDNTIAYSIGAFDNRFRITKEQFLEAAVKAEDVWNKSAKKELLKYSDDGKLKINLIFDERQDTTIELRKINEEFESDKISIDNLKSKFQNLKTAYESKKTEYSKLVSSLELQKQSLEKEISYWNKGKMPVGEYESLKQKREDYNKQVAIADSKTKEINLFVDELNSTQNLLNQMIDDHNSKAKQFNNTYASTEREFTGGEYVRNNEDVSIDIYQFDNSEKLTRLLAHEFGHALGLDHNDDPESIMYKFNMGTELVLSKIDTDQLKQACKIK